MQQPENTLPTSEHFQLERLADGVYAAIDIEGQAAHSNAGIVDLGDRTLIFDAFLTPTAAEDLRAAAEHLTGRAATTVVNSHTHTDHCLGNQVFARMSSIRAINSSSPKMGKRSRAVKRVVCARPQATPARSKRRPHGRR